MTAFLRERFVRSFASICLLLCSCYVVSTTNTVLLEAEKGITTGELKYRDSASNGESVYLTHEEDVVNSFTTKTECSVVVLNVRYSEGSAVDTATVSIDGQDVGAFRTTAISNSGDPWNDFHDSGQIGDEITLAAGEHLVKIVVSTTDEYGMEVDYIQLRTACENTTSEEDPTQEDTAPQPTQGSKSPGDGAISTQALSTSTPRNTTAKSSENTEHGSLIAVGVILAIAFTALITVIAAIAIIYLKRRKNLCTRYEVLTTQQNPSTEQNTEIPRNMRP